MGAEPLEYCRAIESYLCQKNGGHLVRIVGPAFELVTRWVTDGVPFKVACSGIDRCCQRRARRTTTSRPRPVRIDHCDADVRAAFDEWRRALGLRGAPSAVETPTSQSSAGISVEAPRTGASLPAHLERALTRLSTARALGRLGDPADAVLDRVSSALDEARRSPQGLRGDARRHLLDRLHALDADLVRTARLQLAPGDADRLAAEAEAEVAAFRDTMSPDAFHAACRAAEDHLVRERFDLPTLAFA